MQKNISDLLLSTPLFKGFSQESLRAFIKALPPTMREYAAGEVVILAGYETQDIGIVVSGKLEATKESKGGAIFAVAHLATGSVVGDVLSSGQSKSPVTVRAVSPCCVLFFNYPSLLRAGDKMPQKLLTSFLVNLVSVVSDKYFALDKRIDLLLLKTLRQKITSDLSSRARKSNSSNVQIPYSQSSWAAHLGCERSALSRELSRMASDGLILHEKRNITILKPKL